MKQVLWIILLTFIMVTLQSCGKDNGNAVSAAGGSGPLRTLNASCNGQACI